MHDALRRPRRALARLSALLFLALLAMSGGCGGCESDGATPGDAGAVVDAGPRLNPWPVHSEESLAILLGAAQTRAAQLDQRVLLVFLGFGDADSEAVVRALDHAPARAVLAQRYVPVYVNVGRDGLGHTRLRHAHDVRKLATLVVLEATGRRVARTTFSPVTDGQPLSSTALAAWLSAPRGR